MSDILNINLIRTVNPEYPEQDTIAYDYYGTSPTGYVQFKDDSDSVVTFDADDLEEMIEILREYKDVHARRELPR